MQNYLSALIACGLVGGTIAYIEIQGWAGWQRITTFAGCGLFVSMFAASPLMWQIVGLYAGYVEQIAMAIALGAGLWVVVDNVKRWV